MGIALLGGNAEDAAMNQKRLPTRTHPVARPTNGPSCRGGASSLLRVSRADSGRLPTFTHLSNWVKRAAARFSAPPRARTAAFSVSEYGVGSTG